MRVLRSFSLAAVAMLIAQRSLGAPGDLDLTFGSGTGIAGTNFGGLLEQANAVAIQDDGKIVMAGYSNFSGFDFAVARYTRDGKPDTTFTGSSAVLTDFDGNSDLAYAVKIGADGRIVVAGQAFNNTSGNYDFAVAVYRPDGTLDPSFNSTGKVMTPIGTGDDVGRALLIQPDGKIVVAGMTNSGNDDIAVVRYLPNGTLDSTFAGDGIAVFPFPNAQEVLGMALQPDGKLVLCGSTIPGSFKDVLVVRVNADGSIDPDFGNAGVVTSSLNASNDIGHAVIVLSDGRIVVAGEAGLQLAMVRLLNDGTPDSTFGSAGIVLTSVTSGPDVAMSLARQPDGRLVVGGLLADRVGVGRYEANGAIDATFGASGFTSVQVDEGSVGNGLALQTDGKIVITGRRTSSGDDDFLLARFLSAPSPASVVTGPVLNPVNGHVYYLLNPATWRESEAQAQMLGGHLVTISDSAEEQWVINTFRTFGGADRGLWIGMNDAANEGTFVWSSGEPVGYTHWYVGQPDGAGGATSDYAFFSNAGNIFGIPAGAWGDIPSPNFPAYQSFEPICGVVEVSTATPVFNTGSDVPNVQDTVFLDFGVPAIDAGFVGGTATIRKTGEKPVTIIYGDTDSGVVAMTGGPGPESSTFLTLGDPVFAGEALGFAGSARVPPAAIAPFLLEERMRFEPAARIASSAATKLVGLFSRISHAGSINKLAVQGGNAPGTTARFGTLPNFGLPRNRAGLVFTGKLRPGGGVTTKNNFGVWREKAGGGDSDLLLRHNDPVSITDSRVIRKLEMIIPVASASDQRRSIAPDGGVAAAATFADGKSGIVRVAADGSRDVPVDRDSAVPDTADAEWLGFSAPATRSGGGYAMFAKILMNIAGGHPQANNAVFATRDGQLRRIAARGEAIPGNVQQRFSSLGHPSLGQSGLVAFLAGLSGKGVTPKNRTAIVQNRSGQTTFAARLGDPAPQAGDGVVFARFKSVVVTDTPQGQIVFTALIRGPKVTAKNNFGLWCVTASGEVKLLLRSDQLVRVDAMTPKLRSFQSLEAKPANRGQNRSTDDVGFVTAKVRLSDGRTGVLRIALP